MHHIHAGAHKDPEAGFRSPGTGGIDSCEPSKVILGTRWGSL